MYTVLILLSLLRREVWLSQRVSGLFWDWWQHSRQAALAWFLCFRDLGPGWPGISMQLALASCNYNRAASHNQQWLCLNSPFSKMPMLPLSVLQMWPNGYLALRFVLCNSSWLFTWSRSKEDSLTRREGRAEPNLSSFTHSQSKPQ